MALAMRRRSLALLLAATATAAAFAAATVPPAHDVLDTPAQPSALAARSLLNALAPAGTRIVAAGQRGHILLSDDAGNHWKQAEVPVSSDLVALSFPTPEQGWAVGHDGVILHTADGGQHWQRQRDGRQDNSADVPLLDVWFSDAQQGYAVGAFGLVLHTADGGAHWEAVPKDSVDNPKGFHIYAVHGIAGNVYMVGEQGLMLKLDPVSGKFVHIDLPYQGTLFGIVGNDHAIVAFGLRGNAVRSADNGATWQAVNTGIPSGLTAGALDTDGHFLLAGQAGQLLASIDDGASFQRLQLAKSLPAAALLPAGPAAVLVAGPRGVQRLSLP